MLVDTDGPRASLAASNTVSARLEDLQYTLGEGPCVDAHTEGRPVMVPDLAQSPAPRWPAFTPLALDAGARAVFGFPVRIGAARLGALNIYRDRPGPLSDDQHADALVIADVTARAILAIQADAPPGTIAAELETEADFHLAVHQAAGMVSVQLDISVADALVQLRARAFGSGRLVADIATDVVNRTIRFDSL